MSLDNIKLPSYLHQSLFKNNLVEIKSKKTYKSSQDQIKIDFLGGNEKKIIFLVKDSESKFLSDTEMKFFNGLLVACNLNMNDIAFVNIFKNDFIKCKDLISQLHPGKILIFGVSAKELDLPFEIPFFQIQNFSNQQYIIAPSFKELQENIELKKQLWICLQKMFDIKKTK